MSDKSFSSLLPASKPHLHGAIIHDNSQADSGMFSSGSYLSMNGDVDKHGVLLRDQSSLDFYPLRAYIEGDSPKVSVESLWNMFEFLLWLLLSAEPVYCFTFNTVLKSEAIDEILHHDITSKLIMSSTFLMVASGNGQGEIKFFKIRENSGNFICAVDYMYAILQGGCYLSVFKCHHI